MAWLLDLAAVLRFARRVNCSAMTKGLLGREVTVKGKLYEQRLDIDPVVWTDRLEKHGAAVLQVTDEEQKMVRSVIGDVKQNCVSDAIRGDVQMLIGSLVERGADTVIRGCTELPMAMKGVTSHCAIVDSTERWPACGR